MQSLYEQAMNAELVWHQPSIMKRQYELRIAEETIGKLDWVNSWGSLATAELSGERWTFKRVGVFNIRITVRREGSDEDIAVFKPTWTGAGTLSFPDGRTFQWKSLNFWQTDWAWVNPGDHPFVRLVSKGKMLRLEAAVAIEPLASALPELPLLVLLCWYLMVMAWEDASVSTVAVVT